MLSGVNTNKYIKLFGQSHLDWYQKYFSYEHGIPSEATLGRVFSQINTDKFNELFVRWIKGMGLTGKNKLVAVDGKRLRGSYDKANNKNAIHLVSAFAVESGLCIAQESCNAKSNEITTIPNILKQIDQGSIITIDAMGCQKSIAKEIVENQSEYILAVKQNQDELHQQTIKMFEIHTPSSINKTTDIGHGRIESRKCTVVDNMDFMDIAEDWVGIKTVIKIETNRTIKLTNKSETNTRYYISSLNIDASQINKYVRNHWAIENNLHWILDEVFGEDRSRRRKGKSPENFNIISKIAMAILKKANSNHSLSATRAIAGWNSKFRESILQFE